MKKLISVIALCAASSLCAQSLLVSGFDSLPAGGNFGASGSWSVPVDQFSVTNGVLSVAPISGGNPDDSGAFLYADVAPFDGTTLSWVNVAARIDAGNTSGGFSVIFYDSNGEAALYATFAATEFTEASFSVSSLQLTAHPSAGVASDISFFGIAGLGTGSLFRFSFDSVSVGTSAIPEPSTYAALLALAALGFVAYRRRFAVAA